MVLPFFFFLFSPSEQDQVEEKQRYLANVRVFCSLAKNDWHRVYLVRKIASQCGMEFAQKLATEAQFNWVFPVEILQQVKKRCLLGDGYGLLLVFSLCCFGVFLLLRGSGGPTTVRVVAKMIYPCSLLNGVCYGSEKPFGLPCLPAVSLRRLKCHGSWEEEEILPCPMAG